MVRVAEQSTETLLTSQLLKLAGLVLIHIAAVL